MTDETGFILTVHEPKWGIKISPVWVAFFWYEHDNETMYTYPLVAKSYEAAREESAWFLNDVTISHACLYNQELKQQHWTKTPY